MVKDAKLSSILTQLGTVERHLFDSSISANKIEPQSHGTDHNCLLLVMDTGASSFLTPFKANFVDYVACDIPMNTVGDEKQVVGVGTVMYKFCTTAGDTVFLPGFGDHTPQAGVRLASPQSFYKQFGGYGHLNGHEYVHVLANKTWIVIPIDSVSNLPLAYDVACSSADKKLHGSILNASLAEQYLADLTTCDPFGSSSAAHHCPQFCCSCVADEANWNLSGPQKELLQWHWKLCIYMPQIQELKKPRICCELGDVEYQLPPIIKTTFKSTAFVSPPKCMACSLATLTACSPPVQRLCAPQL